MIDADDTTTNGREQEFYNDTILMMDGNDIVVPFRKANATDPEMNIVQQLENSLVTLAPHYQWVTLADLTLHANVKVKKTTKYHKMKDLILAHSDRFELRWNDTTCSVRLK